MIFEVCIDSINGGLAAQAGGADRVEVCDNLVEGGTTPSLGLLQVLRKHLHIEMNAMIRPRGGDFLYTPEEMDVMAADIQCAKYAGCDGVVFGLLTRKGDVDIERTRFLAELARPMSITFHRAFDLARDPEMALRTLIELKIDRLLTSGQKGSALAGAELIANLIRQAQGRIKIMAGAGVNAETLPEIVRRSGVEEIHFSARIEKTSEMLHRNNEVVMGKEYRPDEYRLKVTDAERVTAVIKSLKN